MRRTAWAFLLVGCLAALLLPRAADSLEPSDQLLYSRLTDGTWQIWIKELSKGEDRQLTFSEGDKRYPVWAPEDQAAVHTSNHGCYLLDIYSGQQEPFLEELWPVRDLAWSADGSQVTFSRFRTDIVDHANIWVAESNGDRQRMITSEPGIQFNASWSPDGEEIVYAGGQGYRAFEIYTIRSDGSDQKQLTDNQAHEFFPAWSPDGGQIAFVSDRTGDYEIWMMNADGSDLKQLTDSPGLDSRPAWTAEGSQIAFTTHRSGVLEIWMMNRDGKEQQPLAKAQEGICDPALRY